MRLLRPLIILLTDQAFLALATTFKPFVIQEQTTLNQGSGLCRIGGDPPETHLDNATFAGICIGRTARFLGIPFAQPP